MQILIVYNRDPNAQYGGGIADDDSILNSIQEWTEGAATYIQNVTNSLDNALGPDLKVYIFCKALMAVSTLKNKMTTNIVFT